MTQQARARCRAERRRHLQLRIVVAAGAFQRMRPAVVEHVFAVAVRLGVHRRHRHHLAGLAAQHRVLRQPAGARVGRAAVLHRAQEGVADERIAVTGAGVPVGRRDIGDLLVQRQGQRGGTVGHGASLTDLEHPLHFHGGIGGQRRHADRGARMAAGLAEHRNREVRRAVHHLRMLGELRRRGDEAAEPHHALHPVQIAAAGRLQMHQHIDEAEPRGLLAPIDRDAVADLAGDRDLAVDRRAPGPKRPRGCR